MKGLIFVYVMTYGGAAAALFNPFVGLLVYIAFACLRPEGLWHWSFSGGGNYSRVLGIAVLAGWALHGFGQRNLGSARGIVGALVGFWVWNVVCAFHAAEQGVAWKNVEEFSKIGLIFVAGITLIDSVEKIKQLSWVLVLSNGFFAYQCNLAYYGGWDVKANGFAGLGDAMVQINMSCTAVLAFFVGVYSHNRYLKALAFASMALAVHVVLLSLGRGPMLGLIVSALVIFLFVGKQPKHLLLLTLAVLLALRLAGPQVRERFMSTFAAPEDRDSSAQSRIELWGNCLDSMIKHPLFGLGPAHFPLVSQEYGWPAGKEAHSLWLQVGAELGFPGLLCLITFYGLLVFRLCRTQGPRGSRHPWLVGMAQMGVAAIAGFALAAQFVTVTGLEVPYYVALVGAGALKLSTVPGTVAAIEARWTYAAGDPVMASVQR